MKAMRYLCVLFLSVISAVSEAKVLRVAAVNGPPHVTSSDSNPAQGAAPDFFEKYVFPEIRKKFKMDVVWRNSPFKRELRDLETDQLDMLFFVVHSPEREKIFTYSAEPFIAEQPGMIVTKDFYAGKSAIPVTAFKGKVVGLMAGALVPEYFKEYNIKTFQLSGPDLGERLANLVESHRIDGVFIHIESVTQYLIRKNKFEKLKSVQLTEVPANNIYVAFNKNLSPTVREEIERLIHANRKYYKF